MTETAEKTPKKSTRGRKSTKKTDENAVNKQQIDLLEGKTVAELEAEDEKAQEEAAIKLVLTKTRTTIKPDTKDFTLDEIRSAVKLVDEGTNRVSVVYDPRNYEAIQKIIAATGIKKEVIYDIAIKRFLDWQKDEDTNFPFRAVKDVTPLGTRTTIVISKATKERLDTFCKNNLQQVNLIANLALQALIEEVKAFNK